MSGASVTRYTSIDRRRSRAATPGRAGSQPSEPLAVLIRDLDLAPRQDLRLGDYDEIEPRQQLAVTEALSKQPFGTIAVDRPTHLARRRQPDPAEGPAVHGGDEDEERAVEPNPLAESLPEIGTPNEPLGRAEPRARWRGHPRSGPDPLAPLLAPPLEHEAAALGAHPHEEAVGPLPLAVVGLEGPFHGSRLWPRTSAPDGPRLPWAKVQVYSPLVFPVNPASRGGGS